MRLDTTNFYKKFLKEEWREDQQEEGKEYSCSTIWRMGRTMPLSEDGGRGQIDAENKTVEMVVKDLLLADNRKKKEKSW